MTRRDLAEKALARRSPLAIRFFEWQFARQLQRNFDAIRLSHGGLVPPLDPARPLVIYSNHSGWWDAVIYFYLGRSQPLRDRIGHGPIDAEELRKYPFLDRLGLFGIEMDSYAGAAQFLATATALFRQPNTMLWVCAEGRFTDPRPRPIVLKPGLGHLARTNQAIQFVPLAIEYTFWNEQRPELLLRFGEVHTPGAGDHHEALERALTYTMDALAEDSITRDPARFSTLLQGRRGINPVYDAIRTVCR